MESNQNPFAVRQKESSAAEWLDMIFGGPKGPLMYLCGLKAAHVLFIMI